MIINRILFLPDLLTKKSFFLLGPRATGKSFMIRTQLGERALILNLLRTDLYLRLLNAPGDLEGMIAAHSGHDIVVLDEIQRVPMLLNEVHRLIEEKQIRFLLTGSSARKLRRQHVNLLAGRAWEANLFPLTSQEIPSFDLDKYLHVGGLPPVYLSEHPQEELIAYVNTYLLEEIQAEAAVRKIPAFSRFLEISALCNGQLLNYSSLASDVGVAVSTLREYYQVLEDTLLGFTLPPWQRSMKRKPISTGKFYFFDLGVKNILAHTMIWERNTEQYGFAFEHFIVLELRAYMHYRRLHIGLSFWQSQSGKEVDLIMGDRVAIEIKATTKVDKKDLKGLMALEEEQICTRYLLVSHDRIERKTGNIECIYWENFLARLWADEWISSP